MYKFLVNLMSTAGLHFFFECKTVPAILQNRFTLNFPASPAHNMYLEDIFLNGCPTGDRLQLSCHILFFFGLNTCVVNHVD